MGSSLSCDSPQLPIGRMEMDDTGSAPQTHLPSLRQREWSSRAERRLSWTGFQDEPLAVGILPPLVDRKEKEAATYTFLFTRG